MTLFSPFDTKAAKNILNLVFKEFVCTYIILVSYPWKCQLNKKLKSEQNSTFSTHLEFALSEEIMNNKFVFFFFSSLSNWEQFKQCSKKDGSCDSFPALHQFSKQCQGTRWLNMQTTVWVDLRYDIIGFVCGSKIYFVLFWTLAQWSVGASTKLNRVEASSLIG